MFAGIIPGQNGVPQFGHSPDLVTTYCRQYMADLKTEGSHKMSKQDGATIALVDDDRNILTSVSMALEAEDFNVRTYRDGAEALRGLTEKPADLVVLDIKMPRMDGMELLTKLRRQSDVPAIFLTSKDDEVDEVLGFRMGADDYIISLDGNEQYNDVAGVSALLDAIEGDERLARFNRSILFVEQPISRAVALDVDVTSLSARKPVILDESDAFLGAFPKGRALGYRGVSSKTCKGFYKSILNAARCAQWGDGYFMSGEDLTTQAGIAVQQDLALVNLLGITHLERNGHHYVNGMSGMPADEQAGFLAAHPDIYHRGDGVTRLTIRDGQIALGSLDQIGFAYGAEPNFTAMREMHNG